MTLARRLVAEGVGTALLLAVIVGSGIMAERLADGNIAVALLGITIAIGAGLFAFILMFAPISGAHFNPLVTLIFMAKREIERKDACFYIIMQFIGAAIGVWITHLMFAETMLQISQNPRDGWSQSLSEAVATFGLVGTILSTVRTRPDMTALAVGLYILAACWFTASTSFVNPAVTVARSLTDSITGIAPSSMPGFFLGQIVGGLIGYYLFEWLYRDVPAAP